MKISLSVTLTALLFISIQAQTVQPDKRATNDTVKSARQKKAGDKETLSPVQKRAVEIIDQLSQTAREIDDEQTRIRVRTLIADVLWDYNPDRSRRLFEEVFDATYSLLDELQKGNKVSRLNYGSPEYQLHGMVLKFVSRRDPDLADRLIKKAPEIELLSEMNKQAPLSLQMARNVADTNPERAGQIVGTSLKNGINPMVGAILEEIHHTDPALADKLFLQALSVAQADPNNVASKISVLGAYAFHSYGSPESDLMNRLQGAKEPDQMIKMRFLEFAYEMIMKRGIEARQNGNQQMQGQAAFEYQTLQKLLPYFNQYMPDKVAVVRAQIDSIGRDIPGETIEAITNPFSNDRIDSLLDQARGAKATAERDMLYAQAASYTNLKGDTDKAILIASEIKDEERGSVVESIIRYQAALRALSKEDIDTAYHYARYITFLPQYALAFNRMLGVLCKGKDKQRAEENKQRAVDLLNEAEKFLAKADNGPDKAHSMLTLAEAAVKIDPDRAFGIMQYAVKALNNSDSNSKTAANKRGVERPPVRWDTFNFDLNLTELAKSDPDRALWLAQSLERKELSVLAQLAVCRGMLTKTSEVRSAAIEPTGDKKPIKPANQKISKDTEVNTPQKKTTP